MAQSIEKPAVSGGHRQRCSQLQTPVRLKGEARLRAACDSMFDKILENSNDSAPAENAVAEVLGRVVRTDVLTKRAHKAYFSATLAQLEQRMKEEQQQRWRRVDRDGRGFVTREDFVRIQLPVLAAASAKKREKRLRSAAKELGGGAGATADELRKAAHRSALGEPSPPQLREDQREIN